MYGYSQSCIALRFLVNQQLDTRLADRPFYKSALVLDLGEPEWSTKSEQT